MLRVPELKPGEEGFDPEITLAEQANPHSATHTLSLSEWKGKKSGLSEAIIAKDEGKFWEKDNPDAQKLQSRRAEENTLRMILNHAMIKEAVTQLHCEDDEQMKRLEQYDGIQLCDIRTDHERFLKSQADTYAAAFKTETQRALFQTMSGSYFQQSREKARRLQLAKVRRYREQVVERQNKEFMDRALRLEVVCDDGALIGYRNLILYNIENLLSEAPENERKEKMDAAGRTLYCNILERRLEVCPERLQGMLDAKEVRRVLGDPLWKEYKARAKAALRDDELKVSAKQWIVDELGRDDIRQLAKQIAENTKEEETVLRYAAEFQYENDSRECFTRIAALGAAWAKVKEDGYEIGAIPECTRRNDPTGYEYLCRWLEKRENCGGRSWPVEWASVQPFLKEFSLREYLGKLRDEKTCFEWIEKAGGPESPLWSVLLRFLTGKLSEEDDLFLRDLSLAWGEGRSNIFMERFVRERQSKEKIGELEIHEILRKIESLETENESEII